MSDDRELIGIQQQLEQIMERLSGMFTTEHPRFNDIYEDVSATVYHIEEAGFSLRASSQKITIRFRAII